MKVAKRIKLRLDARHIELVTRGFEHNGVKGEWAYVTRGKMLTFAYENRVGIVATHERVVAGPAAVVVIAKIRGAYVLNKEFRVPLVGKRPSCKCWEIGFPAGLIDKGETPALAAVREFAEETPYKVVSILDVSPPLASSSGITDEMVYIVRCTAELKEDRSTARESAEDIETFLARDYNDPRIPKGEDIVWSLRAWMELENASRQQRPA